MDEPALVRRLHDRLRRRRRIHHDVGAQRGARARAAIYEQIVGKLMLGAEDMGEQHVKNIPRPRPPVTASKGLPRLGCAVSAIGAFLVTSK